MIADEIEYKIYGDDMQMVSIVLDPNESVVAEAGNMMIMTEAIEMDTIFGDGSKQNDDLLSKMVGAGKRLLTGESLFMTLFTNVGPNREQVTFAAPFPGKILPIDLTQYQGEIICQKDSFLCAAKGVSIGIAFNKKIGVGLFGGEGFIMERLQGDGLTFIHAGGTLVKKELKAGEVLKVDTGCLVALTRDVSFDIQRAGGIKTSLFGGEGLFLSRLTGPGTVWLQSLPFSRLARRVVAASGYVSEKSNTSQGEGSLIGGVVGDFLRGDTNF